jgi:hypothetical protein
MEVKFALSCKLNPRISFAVIGVGVGGVIDTTKIDFWNFTIELAAMFETVNETISMTFMGAI